MSDGYIVTSDGGVELFNNRGSLALTRHQLAVVYLLGKQEQEAREKRNDGIDAAVEAASIEIERLKVQLTVERGANSSLKLEVDKYRELEKARGQGYDAIREVMKLKEDCRKMMEEMVTVKDERATYKEQLRITNINLTAAQSDRARLTKELQQEKDAHTATKYQMNDIQQVASSFADFKKAIDAIWKK